MTASEHLPLTSGAVRGRLWWLPADGFGIGLDDETRAPILEVDVRVTSPLMNALRDDGVPAWAAPALAASQRAAPHRGVPIDRIWVGTSAFYRAEDTREHEKLAAVSDQLPQTVTRDGVGGVVMQGRLRSVAATASGRRSILPCRESEHVPFDGACEPH